jgi:FkbM family methyltransferase
VASVGIFLERGTAAGYLEIPMKNWLKRLYWGVTTNPRVLETQRMGGKVSFLTRLLWLHTSSPRNKSLTSVRATALKRPVYLRGGTSDCRVFVDVLVDGEYAHNVPGDVRTIIDCGANIGLTTLYFHSRYPQARVIAIEPEPSNFELAKRNLAPYPQLSVIRAAVWPTEGNLNVKLGYRDGHHWAAQVAPSDSGDVPAVTMDGLIKQHNVQQIDILKIDIEGAERELFSGNVSWLGIVRCIMIELHDSDLPGCEATFMQAIAPYGFDVRKVGETTIALRHD